MSDDTVAGRALAARVLADLASDRLTLATAESLTGGGLAALVTSVPGASAVFVGSVVSYATRVKGALLDVSEEVVRDHGVVSAECAEAMARGVRRLLQTSYALSTTGVAGPDTQEGRPVGTVFVACAGPAGVVSRRLSLGGAGGGDRDGIRDATCREALALLADLRTSEEGGVR